VSEIDVGAEFMGDWDLVEVRGYTLEELRAVDGVAGFRFFGDEKGGAELWCADVSCTLDVAFTETPEGLPAIQFTESFAEGAPRVRGRGAIVRDGWIKGSLTIRGGRARAFVAKRMRGRE